MMAWLCLHPGPWGECRSEEPPRAFATRPACIREFRARQAIDPHVTGRCRLARTMGRPIGG
jgi:hypothetical protein